MIFSSSVLLNLACDMQQVCDIQRSQEGLKYFGLLRFLGASAGSQTL